MSSSPRDRGIQWNTKRFLIFKILFVDSVMLIFDWIITEWISLGKKISGFKFKFLLEMKSL